MRKVRKTREKTYFVALNKEKNTICIATYKQKIAEHLSIHVITVTRQLENVNMYDNSKYTIWKSTKIHKRDTGFKLNPANTRPFMF